eukprot:CCRYP_013702-RC/>CCRYP_013702-RC protein AED:0.39 eAED:0.39 QI:0/0/0/1/0/0/2/0/222
MFTLIVDDFGVEYVGEHHAHHLCDTIKEFYDLTENWKGDLYAGINLAWNYSNRTLLTKYNYQRPKRPVLSPYKAAPIIYGAKVQYTDEANTSPALDALGIKRIQGIVGALLYYAQAVDNKLLHALSEIGTKQAAATGATNTRLNHLLDYCATYPNYGRHPLPHQQHDPRGPLRRRLPQRRQSTQPSWRTHHALRRQSSPFLQWTHPHPRPNHQICRLFSCRS